MDVLIVLVVSVILRVLFRRRDHTNTLSFPNARATVPSGMRDPIAPSTPERHARGAQWRLLLRAVYGMLLAFLCVVFALIPWPAIGTTSAAVARQVYHVQTFIVRHVDIVTIGIVTIAVAEPLLVRLVQFVVAIVVRTPGTIWRIAQLITLLAMLAYWRVRRSHARRRWQRCRLRNA